MIRIAKDFSTEEMANFFEITSAYVGAIESGKRIMHFRTLKYGLNNLNITFDDYVELDEFSSILLEKDIEDREKFKYMMMKTIGILTPEIRFEIDEILNNTLSLKTR